MSMPALTASELTLIVSTLWIRIHDLRERADLSYAKPDDRQEDLAEAALLRNIVRKFEGLDSSKVVLDVRR